MPTSRGRTWAGPRGRSPRRSTPPGARRAASACFPWANCRPWSKCSKPSAIGLAAAVFVIFVLLTAYFQSSRLALISVSAVPGVLGGVVVILYVTGTTLNIESFMGSIMCMGVSVSNSVMLVTFMARTLEEGTPLGRGGRAGRERTLASDPDDRLRHDRRHGADGARAGSRAARWRGRSAGR